LPQRFERFLKEEFRPLREKVDIIERDVKKLKDDVAALKGSDFEREARERAPLVVGKEITEGAEGKSSAPGCNPFIIFISLT
jgi:hypothetical protein